MLKTLELHIYVHMYDRFVMIIRIIFIHDVPLQIDCTNRTEAILSFKEEFSFTEGARTKDVDDQTPEELFRFYPVTDWTPPAEPGKWKPNPNLVPSVISSDVTSGTLINYDLYIKFEFHHHAELKFEMYGTRNLPSSTPVVVTTHETTTTHKPKLRKNKYKWGIKDLIDKRVREPVVTLVAEHAVVQETVSRGCRSGAFVLFGWGNFVLSYYLRAYANNI